MSGFGGNGQPINLTKFGERVFEPILRELTGASVAARDALGHVSTATTEAHYEKPVPEAVLKGMRLLEEKAAK